MAAENKKSSPSFQGVLFIFLGILTIAVRFIDHNGQWRIVDIIKFSLGIAMVVAGIILLIKARRSN